MPPDNMIQSYKFADVDVTLREPQETSNMDSAGFLNREFYLEQYFREAEAFGADCSDVFVWEYVGLNIVRTFRG